MTLIDGWLWATWGPWEVGDGGDGIEKCASVSVNRQDKTTAAAVREHVKSGVSCQYFVSILSVFGQCLVSVLASSTTQTASAWDMISLSVCL